MEVLEAREELESAASEDEVTTIREKNHRESKVTQFPTMH